MTNEEVLIKFKEWLILNNYSIEIHYNNVKSFLKDVPYTEITQDRLNEYFLRRQKEVSLNYYNILIRCVKLLFKAMSLEFQVPKNVKIPETIPDSISLEFLKKEVIPMLDYYFPRSIVRNKAILYLMFYTGLRPSEIIGLKRKDFNLQERTLRVYQKKTMTEKLVPFASDLLPYLNCYFELEIEETNAFNIKKEALYKIFKVLRKHFPNIRFRPYLLRHSYGTFLAVNDVNLVYIQKLMGHKSINSTMKYISTAPEKLKMVYDEAFEKEKVRQKGKGKKKVTI